MNTSAFQCSVFISVMVVMVYSASVHNCPSHKKEECVIRLHHIHNITEHLLKLDLRGWVPKIYKEKCTGEFFCLAEKALDYITVFKNHTEAMNVSQQDKFEDLRRALHKYNNMTNETHCKVVTRSKYQLHEFLMNVSRCTEGLLHLPKSIR